MALSDGLGALAEGCAAMRGLQIYNLMGGDIARSRQFAERLMRRAESDPDGLYLVGAHHALGQTLFLGGQFREARTALEDGLERLDARRERPANWPGGQPGEQCHAYLALTLWMLGYPDRARAEMAKALAVSQASGSPNSLANTEAFAGMLSLLARDGTRMLAHADSGLAISKEYRIVVFEQACRILRGAALLLGHEAEEWRGEIRAAIHGLHGIGLMAWGPLWISALVDPAVNAQPSDIDIASAREVAGRSHRNEERFFAAEMLRLEGAWARASDPKAAERRFTEAIEVARQQAARSLELRAATSLAALLHETGRTGEARDVLEPVYGAFTEGFETEDLRQARALLDALPAGRHA
jgi:adenylate cyclase